MKFQQKIVVITLILIQFQCFVKSVTDEKAQVMAELQKVETKIDHLLPQLNATPRLKQELSTPVPQNPKLMKLQRIQKQQEINEQRFKEFMEQKSQKNINLKNHNNAKNPNQYVSDEEKKRIAGIEQRRQLVDFKQNQYIQKTLGIQKMRFKAENSQVLLYDKHKHLAFPKINYISPQEQKNANQIVKMKEKVEQAKLNNESIYDQNRFKSLSTATAQSTSNAMLSAEEQASKVAKIALLQKQRSQIKVSEQKGQVKQVQLYDQHVGIIKLNIIKEHPTKKYVNPIVQKKINEIEAAKKEAAFAKLHHISIANQSNNYK